MAFAQAPVAKRAMRGRARRFAKYDNDISLARGAVKAHISS